MPDVLNDPRAQLSAAVNVSEDGLRFLNALVLVERWWSSVDDILAFLEKPWQYADEWKAWNAAGRPDNNDGEGWDQFLTACDQ